MAAPAQRHPAPATSNGSGGPAADRAVIALEDAALLAQLRKRDERALDQLLHRFGDALMRTAWLVLGDGSAADDAVQQTLIAAWEGAHRTRLNTPLRPWLFGILTNICRKWQRSTTRRRRHEQAAAAGRVEVDPPEPVTDEALALERMRQALAALSVPLREVVVLRFEQGLSVDETADALGIAVGTVKSRTHAAVAELRRRLGAAGFETEP